MDKGETVEIKSNTARERLNISGALSIQDLDVIVRAEDTINADAIVMLLEEIEAKNPIYVIADNARYNRARKVQEYLATSRIQMIFLPAYSPNLNLIERLWRFFKKKILYNKYYETFEEFKAVSLCHDT